jgi:ribosomal protein S18 acetylase RimI-like enzyme
MIIQIRQASPADVEALIALSRRTIRASYRPFLGHEAVNTFIGSGAVDQYVADHVEHSTVIVANGDIVGYAVCRGQVIDLMMIDQRHHRRGFGTRLLQHCEGALFAHYHALTLESFADNRQANNFYRKHGWEHVDQYFDRESGVNKLVFRKSTSACEKRRAD